MDANCITIRFLEVFAAGTEPALLQSGVLRRCGYRLHSQCGSTIRYHQSAARDVYLRRQKVMADRAPSSHLLISCSVRQSAGDLPRFSQLWLRASSD
ncbi:hypothetical protein J6590_008376 [Homalodisca vitripennis]|nr:hypothetical protein J6590_008376 [Homalodisca vitripennis]